MKKLVTLTAGLMLVAGAAFANTEGFAPQSTSYWLNPGLDTNFVIAKNSTMGADLAVSFDTPIMKDLWTGDLNAGISTGYFWSRKDGVNGHTLDLAAEARWNHKYIYGKIAPIQYSRLLSQGGNNLLGSTVGAGAHYNVWNTVYLGLNTEFTYNWWVGQSQPKTWRFAVGPRASMTF